jgi:hypothetical protein
MTCAAHACSILVTETAVMQFVDKPDVRRKYERLITQSFVERNKFMRWCPARGCSNAVLKVDHFDTSKLVKCECGHVFCFSCREPWHEYIKCEWIKKWKFITPDLDSRALDPTVMWMLDNTKVTLLNWIVKGRRNFIQYWLYDLKEMS